MAINIVLEEEVLSSCVFLHLQQIVHFLCIALQK
jgi:hypothetical protein